MTMQRSTIIARMRAAIKRGQTTSSFIADMRTKGIKLYRRADMYADWRELSSILKAESALERIRTGRIPIDRMAELKVWEMSREYMYKVRCDTITPTREKLEPIYVNIMSDKSMTVEEIEREAFLRAFEQSPPEAGEERRFIFETGYKRVVE
jgi:hypothetical protein